MTKTDHQVSTLTTYMSGMILGSEQEQEGFYHSMSGKPTCQEIYRVL